MYQTFAIIFSRQNVFISERGDFLHSHLQSTSAFADCFLTNQQYKVISPIIPSESVDFGFCGIWSILLGKVYPPSFDLQTPEPWNIILRSLSLLSHKFSEASSKFFPHSPLDSSKSSLTLKTVFLSPEKQILCWWSLIKSRSLVL